MKLDSGFLETLQHKLSSFDALPQYALLGLVSGFLTGLIVLLFRLAIELPLTAFLPDNDPENFEALSQWARFAGPVAGALTIAVIFRFIDKNYHGVGVGHVLERLNYNEGHLTLRNTIVQFFVGVISLVSGQSAGREGPAIHLGATTSSFLGRLLHLPNNSIRVLVGCGTAGAISASFNTPIAGVIFAMEVIMMEYTIAGFTPVILAAVSSAIVIRAVYGDEPAFNVPAMNMESLWDFPVIAILALGLGCVAAFYNFTVAYCHRFHHYNFTGRALIAGLFTGIVAVFVPQIMGISYDSVTDILLGEFGIALLVAVGIGKLMTSATSVGLGLPYGLIGPVVVSGAALGAAFGLLSQQIAPDQFSSAGLYALLGMGAMMAAVLQAPLAALMALLELSGNPHIILPGMLVTVVASITARSLFKQPPIFQIMLGQKGLNLEEAPVTQALKRTGVLRLMNLSFKVAERHCSIEDAHQVLESKPEWILIYQEQEPKMLLPAADLARYLDSEECAELLENSDEEADSMEEQASDSQETEDTSDAKEEEPVEAPTIDLLNIPAKRLDLANIHRQATLQEALDTLHKTGVGALYVTRISAPMITSVQGIITHEDLENFYLNT